MLPSIFNCSNDMALATGASHYVPPKRIQQMEADLADLASLWHGTRFTGPWGWSSPMKSRYRHMGIAESDLPSDTWLSDLRRLSSREHACRYIHNMLHDESLPLHQLAGSHMRFCRTADDVPSPAPYPLIFKSPWSSSGRGVFVAHSLDERALSRLRGFVKAQGGFAMDHFYEHKQSDFAMEFYLSGNGTAEFLGYSVFSAGDHGAYGFNYVEPQPRLIERIGIAPSLLDQIKAYHTTHLAAMPYRGVVGIDMMKVVDGGQEKVHPCVEINMRMNMGVLALILWDRHGHTGELSGLIELTPPREHGFQAVVEDGKVKIIYNA